MKQNVAKTFGTKAREALTSIETATRIDDSDATNAACGARPSWPSSPTSAKGSDAT
jgi:hypothetical protein